MIVILYYDDTTELLTVPYTFIMPDDLSQEFQVADEEDYYRVEAGDLSIITLSFQNSNLESYDAEYYNKPEAFTVSVDEDYDTDDEIMELSNRRVKNDLDLVFNEIFYKGTDMTSMCRNARIGKEF